MPIKVSYLMLVSDFFTTTRNHGNVGHLELIGLRLGLMAHNVLKPTPTIWQDLGHTLGVAVIIFRDYLYRAKLLFNLGLGNGLKTWIGIGKFCVFDFLKRATRQVTVGFNSILVDIWFYSTYLVNTWLFSHSGPTILNSNSFKAILPTFVLFQLVDKLNSLLFDKVWIILLPDEKQPRYRKLVTEFLGIQIVDLTFLPLHLLLMSMISGAFRGEFKVTLADSGWIFTSIMEEAAIRFVTFLLYSEFMWYL